MAAMLGTTIPVLVIIIQLHFVENRERPKRVQISRGISQKGCNIDELLEKADRGSEKLVLTLVQKESQIVLK